MCLFFRSTGGSNITWNIFEQETVFSKSPNIITREKNLDCDNHVGHVGMQVGEWEASLRVDSGSVPSYLLIHLLQDRSDFSLQLLAEESDNFRAQATIQDNWKPENLPCPPQGTETRWLIGGKEEKSAGCCNTVEKSKGCCSTVPVDES